MSHNLPQRMHLVMQRRNFLEKNSFLAISTLYNLRLGLGGTGQNDRTNLPEGDRLGLVRVTEGNPK